MLRAHRASNRERGDAALELVLLAPVLILVLLFVVFCGRLSSVQADIHTAVADGSRAGSQRGSAAAAAQDARDTVASTLTHDGVSCSNLDVAVDTSDYRPGGSITVDATCTVNNSDLAVSGLPGSRSIHARSTSVIDTFRSTP